MQEIRKDINYYEKLYKVSNLWNIKSFRFWKEKAKKYSLSHWYALIVLKIKRSVKAFYIHRLVYEHFIWNIPFGFEINHIDWNKLNNSISNLECCTHSDNMLHAYKTWLIGCRKWIASKRIKSVLQIDKNWKVVWEYISMTEAQTKTWIHQSNISQCVNWINKTWWWFTRKLK